MMINERELDELLERLTGNDAEQAMADLAAVASPALVQHLADQVEAAFPTDPVQWVDHLGAQHEVHHTVLSLKDEPQRRIVLALARIPLPEATGSLSRWTPAGMVLVPAGTFTMGSTENDWETPVHEVWLPAFWLDRYPITRAQWYTFLASEAWERRELWTVAGWAWQKENMPKIHPVSDITDKELPVSNMTWYEALAYARWAGKTLPSEAEWEKAARGTDGRCYPWGDEFVKEKCNAKAAGIGCRTPVGTYSPTGDSPYGVADMSGNVWEWCRNLDQPYLYRADDGRENPATDGKRVRRGGSWEDYPQDVRCAVRYNSHPGSRVYGFRCCWSAQAFSL